MGRFWRPRDGEARGGGVAKGDACVTFPDGAPVLDWAMADGTLHAHDAQQPAPMRRRWGVALRALRRLLADKDDTGQVFEIMRALNGPTMRHCYVRLLRTAQGGRLAYERLELAPRLMDPTWLDGFPAGSVGAAYRDFVRAEAISAEGLAEVARQRNLSLEMRHPYAWFGRRTRDVHDIWHVLTGYGRDALGEACLTGLSFAQTKGLGWGLIAVGAALRFRPMKGPHAAAIWQGYRIGRRAGWLLGEDYVALLAEPLEGARRRLGLREPTVYHSVPAGVRG
jgi:ubiquinone biosynthesis protein COQ4